MGLRRRYPPPPTPPPPKKPTPLLKSPTSESLHYAIDLEKLSQQGWFSLPITNSDPDSDSDSDPLYNAFSSLFEASAQFFSLAPEELAKYRVTPRQAGSASEEGYSRVEGEKCMIALRKVGGTTPEEFGLRERAERAWKASGGVMRDVLRAIEESLGMREGVLVRTAEKQLEMPGEGEGNVATLMRMFRYDRPAPPPPSESREGKVRSESESELGSSASSSRVVSEPHRDLGLLTIVVGHSPGLECWDPTLNDWVSCESETNNEHAGGLNATLLVGQTLAKFTNGRFVAGRHRVFVHPTPKSRLKHSHSPDFNDTNAHSIATTDSPPTDTSESASSSHHTHPSPLTNPSYRFSLVHALRGHLPLLTSSQSFETPITGAFPSHLAWSEVSIGEIYNAISRAHWNVNIGVEERRRQERELRGVEEGEGREGNLKDGRRRRRFERILDVFRRSEHRVES